MCSMTPPPAHQGDLTAQIGQVIDDLTTAAEQDEPTGRDLAEQLASAWAVIAAADPELARKAARYTD
jgi:hypothetical protein